MAIAEDQEFGNSVEKLPLLKNTTTAQKNPFGQVPRPRQSTWASGRESWELSDPRWSEPPLTPTLVSANAIIRGLNEIDSAMGSAHIKFIVCLQWNDYRLADLMGCDVGHGRNDLPPGLWSPQLSVSPQKGQLEVTVKEFARDLDNSQPGDVYKLVEYEGYICNVMNLKSFPFDTDAIEFLLIADQCQTKDETSHNAAFKVDYRLLFEDNKFGEALVADDIAKGPHGWEFVALQAEYIKPGAAQDHVKIYIHLSRRTGYYFNKVLIPLLITVLLNLAQVELPVENLSENLSHCSTLFLSTVALLYVVQDELPKIDYQTVVDSIILYTMYVFALSCFVAVWSHHAHISGDEDFSQLINTWGVPGLTVVYILVVFAQIVPLSCRKRWTKQALINRTRERTEVTERKWKEGRLILEGVQEHVSAIIRDPLTGLPDWLPPPKQRRTPAWQ
mmetsp:Transcript_118147/g.294664  ORF Transcript_118147/g.294664 Transcript_118147/m.294664 type:complete len:446 (-) Transcript_118147:395-1732(-)